MAAPSLTYTLTNGSTADATQVMQNFNDLLNGITDGTKDLSINALTVAGTATLNGNVNLGNATGDDLTITASLASTLAVKTDATYDLGGSTLGFRSLYMGRNSQRLRLIPPSALAASYTMTLPTTAGTNGYVLGGDGSGTLSWVPLVTATGAKSANYPITDTDGFSVILVTTSTSTITVTLPQASTNTYRRITIKKIDTGTGKISISKHASDGSTVIEGAYAATDLGTGTSPNVNGNQGAWITYVSDGTNWWVVGCGGDEQRQSGSSVSVVTSGFTSLTGGLTLTPGTFDISATSATAAVASFTGADICIATTTNSSTGGVYGESFLQFPGTATIDAGGALPPCRVTIAANTNYFLTVRSRGANTTSSGRISANRIK